MKTRHQFELRCGTGLCAPICGNVEEDRGAQAAATPEQWSSA